MKKLFLILFAGVILLSLTCGGDTEADITIDLTNPQDLAVKYNGYYILTTAPGDTVPMDGYTPDEYTFTLQEGDGASGMVYKDTIDIVDTLHFRLLMNGDEELSQKTTTLIEVIQFQITAQ